MTPATETHARTVLATALGTPPAKLAAWRVSEFKAGYLFAAPNPEGKRGAPFYLVLGERVALINLAHTSVEREYDRLEVSLRNQESAA
jgi:hypothetical protein